MYQSEAFSCPLGMRTRVFAVSVFAVMLPASAVIADPLPVNQIVAFGDSLTDTGNASIATLGVEPGSGYAYRSIPGVPFQVGEFTNPPAPGGPSGLWIDQFAANAGLPDPQPFLAPGAGTNFAVAGADTGSGLGNVTFQLDTYLLGKTSVPSTSLYSFWAGANDLIAGNNPVTAANSLEANIATLAGEGGKYFLWLNLPDLGNTPRGQASGQAAALNAASAAFDAQLATDSQTLDHEYPGIVLVDVNIETLFNDIIGDPGKYGFTGLVEPQGADLNGYAFSFDGLHPTSYADQFIADLALTDFQAAITPSSGVPEPANIALLLIGLGALAAFRSKAINRS